MFRNIGPNEEMARLGGATLAALAALKLPMNYTLRNVLKALALSEMVAVVTGYSPLNHALGINNAPYSRRFDRLRQRVGLSHLQRRAKRGRMGQMKRRMSRAMQMS